MGRKIDFNGPCDIRFEPFRGFEKDQNQLEDFLTGSRKMI